MIHGEECQNCLVSAGRWNLPRFFHISPIFWSFGGVHCQESGHSFSFSFLVLHPVTVSHGKFADQSHNPYFNKMFNRSKILHLLWIASIRWEWRGCCFQASVFFWLDCGQQEVHALFLKDLQKEQSVICEFKIAIPGYGTRGRKCRVIRIH